ncbi:SRPBCC family protein [Actinokineospora bangkokensis]|uniref:Uncharacterized protein n=1 Tax=Actinokineospora bangkokensis TaxID=1193682 RepID=A0A1Q9LQJ2_9PSEU|nr:SRPBCC family protein [Actinokineospora bangkokensis]OLR94317.1 hypothetical protein BJP25_11135 [Actinokineospora bangkokensis]
MTAVQERPARREVGPARPRRVGAVPTGVDLATAVANSATGVYQGEDEDPLGGVLAGSSGYPRPMSHYSHTTTAAVPADEVFAYVADVRHLPDCIPGLGEEADHACAWVHVDRAGRCMRWGADGPDDYHGSLTVTETSAGQCEIEVQVTTTRGEDPDVRRCIKSTVVGLTRAVAAA